MIPDAREYVFVCTGPSCGERGGKELLRAWKDLLVDRGEWERCRAISVQCFGDCATGPNICVHPHGEFHSGVEARDAEALLDTLLDAPLPREAD